MADSGYLSFGGPLFHRTVPDTTQHARGIVPAPSSVSLSAYPNPFNSQTTITLDLPYAMSGRVVLYDITGRQELVVTEQRFEAGRDRILLQARGLPSGVHIVAVESDRVLATQKLMLLK